MKEFFFKIISSPVTYFNLVILGVLILIGVIHNHAHHSMEKDVHGYVKQFCRRSDVCQFTD
jgi:hypothetical protein